MTRTPFQVGISKTKNRIVQTFCFFLEEWFWVLVFLGALFLINPWPPTRYVTRSLLEWKFWEYLQIPEVFVKPTSRLTLWYNQWTTVTRITSNGFQRRTKNMWVRADKKWAHIWTSDNNCAFIRYIIFLHQSYGWDISTVYFFHSSAYL